VERHSRLGPSIRFGPFELDVRSAELHYNGHTTPLHEQPFQVLLALLERPGELISREELVHRLWPDGTFVDYERGLNKAVNKLRDVLRDSADSPRFVETIPRRGYRFIAPLEGGGSPKKEDAALAEVAVQPTEDLAKSQTARAARRRKFAVLGVLTAVAVVTYLGWRHFDGQKTPQSRKIMLAVLPFENLSGDPEEEYFSAGMTEEMITQLGSLQPERIGVIARASSTIYKSSKKGMGQIGKELGVDYVLESSVRRSGGRVRITAQLIQVSDQTHVWAQSYDRDLRDVLAVQSDVARAIANEIEVKLPAPADRRLIRPRPLNQEAYEDYLKGKYFLSKCCEENWAKSGPYFEHAIEKDPDYAPAYAGLANYYSTVDPAHPGDRMTKAETAAQKALALDDTLADAHVAMARVELYYRWEWVAAERELRRALELNPSDPDAHHVYSDWLAVMGRVEESAAEMRRAGDLDPLWAQLRYELGAGLFAIGHYDEAIAAYRKALELDPGFAQAHQEIGEAFEKKGMYKESMEEWQAALRLEGDNDTASLLQSTYISSGFGEAKKTVLQKQIQQLKERSKREYVSPTEFAYGYAKINDKDQAFAWLEKAYEEREWYMPFLKVIPWFENLRSDPRLAELARRVGIP
jgi:TolB-like protein/DNA-binding winged helix-turn-helix (wHTH) protein/Tfp pilus assembly protein PilF